MRPRPDTVRAGSRLRVFLAAFVALSVVGLVLAGTAGADAITPESGPTQNASDIDTLYKIVFVIGAMIVGLVWAILFYSLFRYRARRGAKPPQIRGNFRLELGWTIAASLVVTAVATVTFFFLDNIRDPVASGPSALAEARGENAAINQPSPPGKGALHIKVSGQQYFWRYQYPNGAVSFHDMVVPKDTTVTLSIESNDVAHSWWIPKLGGKFDAIRGLTNETWFKATRTGTFTGQCSEFCGTNHAFMTAKVIVVEPDRYQKWVTDQKNLIAEARKLVQEQRKKLQASSTSTSTSSG
jgi:cytochrome c oxidase subunit II